MTISIIFTAAGAVFVMTGAILNLIIARRLYKLAVKQRELAERIARIFGDDLR